MANYAGGGGGKPWPDEPKDNPPGNDPFDPNDGKDKDKDKDKNDRPPPYEPPTPC
jgi:hypothetical protein